MIKVLYGEHIYNSTTPLKTQKIIIETHLLFMDCVKAIDRLSERSACICIYLLILISVSG
jgi:hypothetical protein